MEVILTNNDKVLIAQFSGSLDTITSPEAERQLMIKIEEGEKYIIIDFDITEYVSSSGLRVLLKVSKMMKQRQGSFSLCCGNEQILEVLEISGFLQIMKHFPTLEEATSFAREK